MTKFPFHSKSFIYILEILCLKHLSYLSMICLKNKKAYKVREIQIFDKELKIDRLTKLNSQEKKDISNIVKINPREKN